MLILAALIISAPVAAQQIWLTTESKIDIDTVYTQRYGQAVDVAGASTFRIFVKCDDIRSAGYASDSCVLYSGYRTMWVTGDKLGNKDTIFSAITWMDTLSIKSMDTSSVTGYAVDVTPQINAPAGQYMQCVIKPAVGTRIGKSIGWVMAEIQRIGGTYMYQRK
jgi:hypothetical protein